MKRRSLVWRIYPTYLLIILISILAISWLAVTTIKHVYIDRLNADLKSNLLLLEPEIVRQFDKGDISGIDRVCKSLGSRIDTRFTVILPNGKVVGDTRKDPATMDNHADRPEVIAARKRGWGQSIRFSYTLKQPLMYVAHPIRSHGKVIAILRAALPVSKLNRILGGIYRKIIFGGLLIAGLAALLCFLIAEKIAYPLREMTQVVQEFAKGNLNERVPPQEARELSILSEAMNEMAGQLRKTIETVVRQKQELEVILSSMSEGVIAVDLNDRVMSINARAADLLKTDRDNVKGESFYEVVGNWRLQNFIKESLNASEPRELTILFGDAGRARLQLHSAPLRGEKGQRIGTVVVMNDVTQLHRLEKVRRDFVANVSHELKTPITAIQGAVETLQETALEHPEDARRFLSMLSRQVEKLNALIEDILSLARVEQGVEKKDIPFEKVSLTQIARHVTDDFRQAAERAGIALSFLSERDVLVRANANLVEQALGNLLDNAIKYTPRGGRVDVIVKSVENKAVVSVKDTGIGIPEAAIPRIFERFYRVEKSRSRELGGTGLGLSLVRNIMNALGGRVQVASREGKGSVFSLIFSLD